MFRTFEVTREMLIKKCRKIVKTCMKIKNFIQNFPRSQKFICTEYYFASFVHESYLIPDKFYTNKEVFNKRFDIEWVHITGDLGFRTGMKSSILRRKCLMWFKEGTYISLGQCLREVVNRLLFEGVFVFKSVYRLNEMTQVCSQNSMLSVSKRMLSRFCLLNTYVYLYTQYLCLANFQETSWLMLKPR